MQDDRYARHALIDWFSQDRVRDARFIVAGAGAIGNEVIKNLALLGAGHITIHDSDRIERHNLTRSVLFREDDVGRDKAEVAAARARELDPSVDAVALPGDFWTTLSFRELREADCVVGCVDNFEARIRLSRLCRLAGTNLIDVAIDTRHASVETFPFAQAPDCACYECSLPPGVYERIAQRYSCAGLRRIGLAERRIPTTILTSSTGAALAVSAAMRLLHVTREAAAARRVMADTIAFTAAAASIARGELCPGCGDLMPRVRIVACGPITGGDPLPETGAQTWLRLSDKLVTGGTCPTCGYALREDVLPLPARDHDERLSRCPACGGDMAIIVTDQVCVAELHDRFGHRPIPVRFAAFDTADETVVFDFHLGAGEAAACQFPAAASS
jgi:molybdopterin/thiamine biosynthesis adenylyltransferase